jgi:hypothetical protein
MRKLSLRSSVVLLASLHGLGSALASQTGSITGNMIKAVGGGAIEGGRVELVGTRYNATTSTRGEFAFRDLAPGKYTIQASAIGFAKLSAELEVKANETLEVEFQAQLESVRLADLVVKEGPRLPPEFVRRSQEGGGRYMSRAEIERRPGAANVSDLLRTFPGVRVNCRRSPCTFTFTRATRNCPPAFFLDGVETESMALALQPAREVDGIEVYSGLAELPPELRGRSGTCGAFVVWTRTPPDARKRP